jgi:PAS domain S-box-containing protein
LLSAIVESSHDAIVSKTLDGVITSWNKAAERIFGYTAQEAIGRSIRIIIPPECQAEEDYILSQIRRGQWIDHFETVRQAKDGRRLSISLTVSPIRNAQGVIVGASKIARDITEQKRLQAEREELLAREQAMRQELAEAVAARDELIAVAAHELRNPLNALALSWQLLYRMADDPTKASQLQSFLARSRTHLDRLSALIDRLLDIARVRAGTLDLHRERFDLSGLLREIVGRFAAEDPGLPISLELASRIEGEWDRLRIDQAIANLVSNAVKYGAGKPIVVGASLDGRDVVVSVRDHGVGIARKDLSRIFDRFERGVGRSREDGSSLGLCIAKRIVEAHGGNVVAESALGQGSALILVCHWGLKIMVAGEHAVLVGEDEDAARALFSNCCKWKASSPLILATLSGGPVDARNLKVRPRFDFNGPLRLKCLTGSSEISVDRTTI